MGKVNKRKHELDSDDDSSHNPDNNSKKTRSNEPTSPTSGSDATVRVDGGASACETPICPDGCSKIPKINAKQINYTVVLDKTGNLWVGYPVLEFEITDGCPNHYIDIQVAKKDAGLLSAGPGLAAAWDKTKLPKDRITQQTYSSWSNGERSIKLDGLGKANYKMPLDWWKDIARQPRKDFTTMAVHYRVLAFCDSSTTPVNSLISKADVINNLADFKIVDLGYVDGGIAKSIRMEFTVKEANTTEMYTFVQWMQGYNRKWKAPDKKIFYGRHRLYDIIHIPDFPDWTVDRLHTNPRYHDDIYTKSADGKTASATDEPSQGAIAAGFTHYYSHIDFETRVHLNFDVPAAVTIVRQDILTPGPPPSYGVITGIISPPEPIILDITTWNTRVLQIRNTVTGAITLTRPDNFAGP